MTFRSASVLFIVASIVIGLMGAFLYLIFLPFKRYLLKSARITKAGIKKINTIYILILLSIAGFATYTALFPMDSYYKDEFKLNTGIDMPLSANIINKDCWYPDIHGKYWAAAIVKLNKNDYTLLNEKISKLNTFKIDTTSQQIGVTADYNLLTQGIKKDKIRVVFFNVKKHWFKVAFLKDRQTIIFERN